MRLNSGPLLFLATLHVLAGCGDTSYDESSTASIDEGQGVEEVGSTESEQRWCQPGPVAYDVAQIPSLPPGVQYEGFCEGPAMELPEGEPTARYVLDSEAQVLEGVGMDHHSGARFESTFTFDDAGLVRNIFITGTTGFYTTGIGSSWYDLNTIGELTHKVAAEMPWEDAEEELWTVLVKDQAWDGDRLLSRTEREGQDGPVVREWSWRWDAQGRLTEAMLVDRTSEPSRRHAARWGYHVSGAPAQVERSLDGVLVERQAWNYSSDGALSSRSWSATSPAALAATHGGEPSDWLVVKGLDDHELRSNPLAFDVTFEGNPWDEALPTERADGCTMLPRSAGHGYPGAAPEYWLGVASDSRPYDIGVAYGTSPESYARRFNDLSWYGHDGVGAGWLTGPGGASMGATLPERVEVTVHYDARGHMTHEEASLLLADGFVVDVERTRALDGGGLVQSDLLKARLDDELIERELRFERDGAGRLTARELLASSQVVERQTWARDSEGRVLLHAVEALESAFDVPGWALAFGGDRAQEPLATSWAWSYDGEHVSSRSGGPRERATLLEHDGQGRVTRLRELEGGELLSEHSTRFDEAGRVVEECQGWGATTPTCTSTFYDDQGRVAWREVDRVDLPSTVIELNQYVCP